MVPQLKKFRFSEPRLKYYLGHFGRNFAELQTHLLGFKVTITECTGERVFISGLCFLVSEWSRCSPECARAVCYRPFCSGHRLDNATDTERHITMALSGPS